MSHRAFLGFMTVPLLTVIAMAALWWVDTHELQLKSASEREKALNQEVIALLQAHYDGKVDRETLISGGLQGIASAVEDRHTVLWPPAVARQRSEESSGKYAGVGTVISPLADGRVAIRFVFQGGPADKAGMKPNDIINAVDGKEINSLSSKEIQDLVRGEPGSEVTITVERDGDTLDLKITRGLVTVQSIHGARILPDTDVGYLRIGTFSGETVDQFESAFESLRGKGMKALMIDLRDNGGGLLDAAVQIADHFIKEKDLPIVSMLASKEKLERRAAHGLKNEMTSGIVHRSRDEKVLTNIPVVFLVNDQSASASEILAGALQDYDRAYLVGTRTYGKGSVQRPFKLPSDERFTLKITVARYYTPLGKGLMRKDDNQPGGIEPDLHYAMTRNEVAEMLLRFRIQQYQVPDDDYQWALESDKKAWASPDPHIQAALAYLRGEAFNIPLSPSSQ